MDKFVGDIQTYILHSIWFQTMKRDNYGCIFIS